MLAYRANFNERYMTYLTIWHLRYLLRLFDILITIIWRQQRATELIQIPGNFFYIIIIRK